MIPVCWDEISTRHAGTDFTNRLHEEIKFHLGKVGHVSTWHFFRFVHIFFLKCYRHLLAFSSQNDVIYVVKIGMKLFTCNRRM